MAAIHEELLPRVAQGLGSVNNLIDINGNGTDWSGATTVATANTITAAKVGSSSFHEADNAIFTINQRVLSQMLQMGIFTNTEADAATTTANWRAGFTDNDASLPASYHGTRGMN